MKYLYLAIILVGISIIAFLLIDSSPKLNNTFTKIKNSISNSADQEKINNQNSPTQSPAPSNSGSSSSGGSGGGGGGSSGGQQQIPENCAQRISYGLTDFTFNSLCITEEEPCLEKQTTCTLNVKNLDHSSSGSFTIKFSLKDSTSGETIEEKFLEKTVEPRETEEFEVVFQTTGEDAQETLSCTFQTENIPVKNIC